MLNLKKSALSYHKKFNFNITVISNYKNKYNINKNRYKHPSHFWEHYTFLRQTKQFFYNIRWSKAIGIGVVLGYNNLRAIDIDDCNDEHFLQDILSFLGFPADYEWVVKSGSDNGFHILFYSDDNYSFFKKAYKPRSKYIGLFKRIEFRWYSHLVLPPSMHKSGFQYSFLYKDPKSKPLYVNLNSIYKIIKRYCNISNIKLYKLRENINSFNNVFYNDFIESASDEYDIGEDYEQEKNSDEDYYSEEYDSDSDSEGDDISKDGESEDDSDDYYDSEDYNSESDSEDDDISEDDESEDASEDDYDSEDYNSESDSEDSDFEINTGNYNEITKNTILSERSRSSNFEQIHKHIIKNEEILNRYGIKYFYHITHIDNLFKILEKGLLSHNIVNKYNLNKCNISNSAIVLRRGNIYDPIFGKPVNDYAPLYINPKNPMLFVNENEQENIVILCFDRKLILKDKVLFTDGNAASNSTEFYKSILKLDRLRWDILKADFWSDFDDGKRCRMAEVLVYKRIKPNYIRKIICYNKDTYFRIKNKINFIPIEVNKHYYF